MGCTGKRDGISLCSTWGLFNSLIYNISYYNVKLRLEMRFCVLQNGEFRLTIWICVSFGMTIFFIAERNKKANGKESMVSIKIISITQFTVVESKKII